MMAIEKRIQKIESTQPKYATIEDVLASMDQDKQLLRPLNPELIQLLQIEPTKPKV
jgi:hypothetical protein